MSRLADFYLGRAADHAGRMIDDIWQFSLDALEEHHDYIQWLFPIDTRSPVNPLAPVLDESAASEFGRDDALKVRVLKSFDMMLRFYGLQMQRSAGQTAIARARSFHERSHEWLSRGNHNHLRLTRIIRCLHLCGLDTEAKALLAFLKTLAAENPLVIDPASVRFWENAVR